MTIYITVLLTLR